jgi:ABC-2 type transport system ATP-binding protein
MNSMENTDAVIQLSQVSKRYGATQAMDDVSLEIPRGVVFALLGENGAGKTTTIKTILGLEDPDQGSIRVLGLDPRNDGIEIRRRVGYVPDAPKLYDWMKVSEIGWFAGGFYPAGYAEEFKRLADEFELPLDVKIKTLSKGGRAKVALALAMAHRPELLILDEPTSGLDTLVRRKFLESMVDVAAEGRTVLLSSHQIPEVERVADQVAVINHGVIRVNDRLDLLKQQIEQWVVTLSDPGVALPTFDRFKLMYEGQGRRRQLLTVREPDPESLWQLRDHPGVLDVEVHTPSLEEIFVAYLKAGAHSDPRRPGNAPREHAAGHDNADKTVDLGQPQANEGEV